MPAIQNRNLVAHSPKKGRVSLAWQLLPSDPANAMFFVEHMVNGTWRFPTEDAAVGTTAIEFDVDAAGPQQFRVIAPDGSPSETATVDPSGPSR